MILEIDTEIALYSVIAIVFLLIIWLGILEHRIKKLSAGKNGKSLEGVIMELKEGFDDAHSFRREMEKYLLSVEKRLAKSIRAFDIVKFNAFREGQSGGNQCFAVAYLNEQGDGVVFSSLYAREHTSVFCKAIKQFKSQSELTPEEKQAVEKAKANLRI